MEYAKLDQQLTDTASSDFYTRKQPDFAPNATPASKAPYADRGLVEGLEAQASRIREVLCGNTMRIERLECREELNSYAAETAQELAIIQNKNQAELAIVKDDFQKNMGTVDRQLASLKREWKNFKEKQEGELAEAMDELKAARTQNQATLSTLLKDSTADIKCKFAALGKEVRETKRVRGEKKAGMMQELEMMRVIMSERVEGERKKRSQYQEIVLVLLDKTCEQGEKILRRIC